MSVQRIASRYAKSIIELAQEQQQLELIYNDMLGMEQLTENRDFRVLLRSPVVNPSRKQQAVDAVMGTGKFQKLTTGFVRLLIAKGRERFLPETIQAFIEQYKQIKNISSVRVTTAVPVSEKLLAEIRRRLFANGKTDDQIEMETIVDPDIIGGIILEFDGKLLDASVADSLVEMKKEFTKVNVYRSQVERK